MVTETETRYDEDDAAFEAAIAANRNFMAFRALPIAGEMNYKQAMLLFSCMRERQFKAGDVIYRAGEISGQEVHLILDGRFSAIDPSGHVYGMLRAGDLFGLFSFLDEARLHSATIRAETEATALVIDRPYFDVVTLEDPALGNQLLRFMFRLLSRMALKLEVEYAAMHGFVQGRGAR